MKSTQQKAFTLIELLIVITIMATIAGLAVLSINHKDSDTIAEREAKRLFNLLKMASDDAIYMNQLYGVYFNALGYDFYKLNAQKDWVKLNKKILKSHIYQIDLETQLSINDTPIEIYDSDSLKNQLKDEKITPHIFLLNNGEINPDFEIKLLNPETTTTFVIKPSESSPISYKKEGIDDDF